MKARTLGIATCAAITGLASQAHTQESQADPARDAISALEFLVGNWAGPGTSYAVDGTQTKYHDTEYVRFDLDQKLLLINATGQRADGSTSYALHTIIYYDVDAGRYIYTPYAGRPPRSFECQLDESPKLVCLNAAKNYRLTFQRLPDGRWNEFGEQLKEGAWSKSFETLLSAVEDTAD